MIGTPVGKYRMILNNFYITKRPACDPTAPEGPRPLVLLKLDPRLFGCLLIWGPIKLQKNPKNPGWCLSKTKGLGPSGVLPLDAPRRVSMDEPSFSPYTLFLVPIVKN